MQPFRPQLMSIALVISALALVSTGIFLLRGTATTAGWVLIIIGITLFIINPLVFKKTDQKELDPRPFSLRKMVAAMLFCVSLLLTGFVVARVVGPIKPDYWVGLAWLIGIILVLVSTSLLTDGEKMGISRIRQFVRSHKFDWFAIMGILVISFLLRTIFISSHPFPWSGDEASIGIEGRRILQGEITNFFDAGWSGEPNWSFIPAALSLSIFGENLFALRLPSVISGALAVVFLLLLAREMFGKRIALIAAIFLAAFPLHLHFSRLGVHNVNDSLMVCLVLWLTLFAIRKENFILFVLAGIGTGLSFYTYVGTRLVLSLTFLALIYISVRRRGYIRAHLPHLGLYSLGLLITLAPMAAFFLDKPDIFMTRIAQSSVFSAGWLENEASFLGISKAAVIWKQFTTTVLVFINKPAVGNFFYSPQPYLTVMGAVFFLLGTAWSLTRLLEPPVFILQAWFWSVILLGGVLTQGAPAHTRLLMTTPALAIFLSLGIEEAGNLLRQTRLLTERRQWVIGVVLITIIGVQNILFYFGEYRTNNYFGDANSELGQMAGMQLRELGPEYDLYLLGNPRVYVDFPTLKFLAPENEKYNLDSSGIQALIDQPVRPSLIVAIPENLASLEEVMQNIPGGKYSKVDRAYQTEVLYYVYRVE